MNTLSQNKAWNYFFVFSLSAYIMHLILAVIIQRVLYADGSAFFYYTLQENANGGFYIYDLQYYNNRFFVSLIGQLPVVILIHLGFSNVYVLSLIYGFTLFFTFPIILLLLYRFLKKNNQLELFTFPLSFFVFLCLPFEIFIIDESFIAYSILIAALTIHVMKITLTNGLKFLLLLIAVFSFQSYQSTFLISGVICLLALIKVIREGKDIKFNLLIFILHGLSTLYNVYRAYDFNEKSNGYAVQMLEVSKIDTLHNLFWIFSPFLIIFIAFVSYYFFKNNKRKLWRVLSFFFLFFLVILYIEYCMFLLTTPPHLFVFQIRHLVTYSLPFVFILFFLKHCFNIRFKKEFYEFSYKIIFITLLISSFQQFKNDINGNDYKLSVLNDIQENKGVVLYSNVRSSSNPYASNAQFLSIILQPSNKDPIKTMFEYHEGDLKSGLLGGWKSHPLKKSSSNRLFDYTEIKKHMPNLAD